MTDQFEAGSWPLWKLGWDCSHYLINTCDSAAFNAERGEVEAGPHQMTAKSCLSPRDLVRYAADATRGYGDGLIWGYILYEGMHSTLLPSFTALRTALSDEHMQFSKPKRIPGCKERFSKT